MPDLQSTRFVSFGEHRAKVEGPIATWYARLQNTLVAWSEVSAVPGALRQADDNEIIVVLPDAGAVLSGHGERAEAPTRSIAILPPGATVIEPKAPGRVIRFFSPVPDAFAALAINGRDYAAPTARANPIGAKFVHGEGSGIRVYPIDGLKSDRPGRPPSFQSETMNVMWIEQDGPHDRAKLSPHSHEGFEEGAVVVAGDYVQHLRTPWASDAGQWREDEHRRCVPGTLTIVPPEVIHTSEALGAGRHIMLNIFAPARADHIKSGMVLNAKDYRPA